MAINPNTIFGNLVTLADVLNITSNADAVGIFNSDTLQQVFENARPLRADVRETSMVMNHPVETGVVLSDHHIINQVEITILLMINSQFYNSTYEQIRASFIAADKLFVQTRTGVYNNMIIADMPHLEDTEHFDAITMALHLKEIIFIVPNSVSPTAQPSNYSPIEPANTNTVLIGQKYATVFALGTAVLAKSLMRF